MNKSDPNGHMAGAETGDTPGAVQDSGLRDQSQSIRDTADGFGQGLIDAARGAIFGQPGTGITSMVTPSLQEPTSKPTENIDVNRGRAVAGVLGIGIGLALGVRSPKGIMGGAKNRAAHESYKDGLRAIMEAPMVTDPNSTLGRIIGSNYRTGAKVGVGSTAAAVRSELATGMPVGGKMHNQKAQETVRALEGWLAKNREAPMRDRAAAENVMRDLQNALEGR